MGNRNIAKCHRCGDIIESIHQHHFVSCKCGAISIDGGPVYRRGLAKDLRDILDLSQEEIDAWDASITGRLEDWDILKASLSSPYVLVGRVYDDKLKRFADGTVIRTSAVRSGQVVQEGALIETQGSRYLLGKKYVEPVKV